MDFPIAKQAFQATIDSEISKVNYKAIRKYFDVSNSYVLQKLLLVIVPFYYKETTLYRPDLYIPALSLITLVLLKAFIKGLQNQFHPEILGLSFTRTVFVYLAVSLFYKALSYFFDASIDFLDILSFCGYKFFTSLIIRVLCLVLFGKILSLYFFVAYFFFLSRSLKTSIITQNSPKTHLYLLFGIVGFDLVVMFFHSFK